MLSEKKSCGKIKGRIATCAAVAKRLGRLCRRSWSLSIKGGDAMVTYEGLFQFCLVVIGIISLLHNRKK